MAFAVPLAQPFGRYPAHLLYCAQDRDAGCVRSGFFGEGGSLSRRRATHSEWGMDDTRSPSMHRSGRRCPHARPPSPPFWERSSSYTWLHITDTAFLTLIHPIPRPMSSTAFPQPSSPLSVPTGQAWCVADGIHGHRLVSIYGDKHGNRNKHRLFETQRTCYAPEPSGIDISLSLVPSLLTLLLLHLSCSAALAR